MNFFMKYFYIMGSVLLTGYFFVIAKDIVNPLLAAFIVALILMPLASKLEQYKISRFLSSILSIVFFLSIFLLIAWFVSTQLRNLNLDVKILENNDIKIPAKIQNWISDVLNITPAEERAFVKSGFTMLFNNSVMVLNTILSIATKFLTAFVFFIISLFFVLYYRSYFVEFLYQIFNSSHHTKLKKILSKMQTVLNRYILGLCLVICIVASLNTLGLFALGIQNAIFFGVIASVLTIIPYVGIMIGALLPILFALLTKDSLWYPVGVLFVFMFVQFLEGNFITPNIVGKQLHINAFAALLFLIAGGLLFGLLGIMLALPILAILNVICEEVKPLKPFSYLISSK